MFHCVPDAVWSRWRQDSSAPTGLLGSSAGGLSPRCGTSRAVFQAHITVHLEIVPEAASWHATPALSRRSGKITARHLNLSSCLHTAVICLLVLQLRLSLASYHQVFNLELKCRSYPCWKSLLCPPSVPVSLAKSPQYLNQCGSRLSQSPTMSVPPRQRVTKWNMREETHSVPWEPLQKACMREAASVACVLLLGSHEDSPYPSLLSSSNPIGPHGCHGKSGLTEKVTNFLNKGTPWEVVCFPNKVT